MQLLLSCNKPVSFITIGKILATPYSVFQGWKMQLVQSRAMELMRRYKCLQHYSGGQNTPRIMLKDEIIKIKCTFLLKKNLVKAIT